MSIFKRLHFFINNYNSLLNWATNRETDKFNKSFSILLTQYLTCVFLAFFTHSIVVILFFGITKNSIFLTIVSFYWLLGILLKEKRKNKILITINFIFFALATTYYSSYAGLKSGVVLYYFPLLLGLPFFYSLKKDYKFTIPLSCFILFCFYFSIITDFQVVNKSKIITSDVPRKKLFLLNATISLLLFLIDFIFIWRKERILYNSLMEMHTESHSEVQKLKEKVKAMASDKHNEEIILQELIFLAKNNDSFFLQKFQDYYFDFFEKLKKHTNKDSELIYADLYLAAMIKLNFNTKQIAIYTRSTVKSVDSKKYRLRKKLNIPAGKEMKSWMLEL